MKKIILLTIVLLLLILANSASAQEYKTALGVRFSTATPVINNSVSIKQFIGNSVAVEGLFSFGDPLALGALIEFHKPINSSSLRYFYGGGGYIGFKKNIDAVSGKKTSEQYVGAQGVVGLDYKFQNIPLNLSLDWKPELSIIQHFNFEPAALGLTARFTFGK